MSNAFIRWLDRYIYVDRLHIRPKLVVPKLRWWQWPWYVGVIAGGAALFPILNRDLERLLEKVPIFNHVPLLVTWPLLGLLYGAGAYFLLPARAVREQAVGEGWLIGAIWVTVALIGTFWFDARFR